MKDFHSESFALPAVVEVQVLVYRSGILQGDRTRLCGDGTPREARGKARRNNQGIAVGLVAV